MEITPKRAWEDFVDFSLVMKQANSKVIVYSLKWINNTKNISSKTSFAYFRCNSFRGGWIFLDPNFFF